MQSGESEKIFEEFYGRVHAGFEASKGIFRSVSEEIAELIEDDSSGYFDIDSVAYGPDGTIFFETNDGLALSLTIGPDLRGTIPGDPDYLPSDGIKAHTTEEVARALAEFLARAHP